MGCFACLSSKLELVNDDDDRRIRLSVTEYKIAETVIYHAPDRRFTSTGYERDTHLYLWYNKSELI